MPATTLTDERKRELAEKVLRYVAFHSRYAGCPHLYQFSLPDGCWLTVEDRIGWVLFGRKRRALTFWSVTGNSVRMPVAGHTRSPNIPHDTPWFGDTPDAIEYEKAIKAAITGIEYSHRNRHLNSFIRDNAMQVDLDAEPTEQEPVAFSGVKAHFRWLQ